MRLVGVPLTFFNIVIVFLRICNYSKKALLFLKRNRDIFKLFSLVLKIRYATSSECREFEHIWLGKLAFSALLFLSQKFECKKARKPAKSAGLRDAALN